MLRISGALLLLIGVIAAGFGVTGTGQTAVALQGGGLSLAIAGGALLLISTVAGRANRKGLGQNQEMAEMVARFTDGNTPEHARNQDLLDVVKKASRSGGSPGSMAESILGELHEQGQITDEQLASGKKQIDEQLDGPDGPDQPENPTGRTG